MAQTVLSVVAEISPNSVEVVRTRIRDLRKTLEAEQPSFRRLQQISTLHFMSLSVFDDPHYDPLLVFENNFDGSPASHWHEVDRVLRVDLRSILAGCKHATDPRYEPLLKEGSALPIVRFLDDHAVAPGAFHIGSRDMTVGRIHRERELTAAIRKELDDNIASYRTLQPVEIHRTLRNKLLPAFRWIEQQERREARLAWWQRVGWWQDLGKALLYLLLPVLLVWIGIPVLLSGQFGLDWGAALAIIVLIPALLAFAIHRLESSDFVQEKPDPNNDVMDAIAARENQPGIAQNHLASMVLIKPGAVRTIAIRIGVAALKHGVRLFATDGYLGPMRTIHFAHWALIGNGGRLLFLSNYDGSWESYLDDFVDKAHNGLTLAWSNCVGFPPTRWLFREGATHGQLFKAWARQSQRESMLWYSAYKELTVNQIERNYDVAAGLCRTTLDATEAEPWVKLL